MEQISVAPPPLPPKTRRSPPETTSSSTTTVLRNPTGDADVFDYRFPEVHGGHSSQNHVVKIRINPENNLKGETESSVICDVAPCIRISVNHSDNEMIQNNNTMQVDTGNTNPYNFFYNSFNCAVMSSGQVSPSDTLDSGTCSDLDGTPPPLPKKKNAGVSVTLIGGQHKRASSLTSSGAEVDSDDNESSISCDSLNSGKISPTITNKLTVNSDSKENTNSHLPQTLLQDIRERNAKLSPTDNVITKSSLVDEKSYEERKEEEKMSNNTNQNIIFDTDMFYKFHLNEHLPDNEIQPLKTVVEDETFAGYKDLLGDGASTIRSAKGTVRGVKNRVRAGIATFLQINSTTKNYKEKDAGKVVVYTTTMGILRDTYQACMKVKQILRTLLVKFEERDVFMSNEYQNEIRERMRCDYILVPQVFVDGQHVGDAETIERLNESGELRRILKPFKSIDACTTCKVCGGYRLLPCQVCKGSKKSVHRNHFTTEFVALKCMNCDEVGLVRCSAC